MLVPFGRQLRVAVIVLRAGTVLALPKGHLEPGEGSSEAAIREVHEETGIRADLIAPIESIEYWFVTPKARVHKQVDFFLLRYRSGAPLHHNGEVESVRLLPLEGLDRLLSYPGERRVAARARFLAIDG